jgi:membrane protein DedA with SNARE-associated domain
MERFVAWLGELPPLTVYLVIGVSTFLENLFPPTPSDVAVALGGFVTQRSGASDVVVWLVAWLANMAGAVVVYLVARRFGRRFLGSRLGRRLLPADAIVSMEREYLRFGVVGIFISRFLPGFRSFVAPFVGIVGLPPAGAFAAMAVASGIWYGVLTWAGVRLGAQWEAISGFISHLNRSLGFVAVLGAGVVGWWLWRLAKREGPRRRRLLVLVHRALGESAAAELPLPEGADLATQGAAALLSELTHADPAFSVEERGAIAEYLRERWSIGPPDRHATSTAQPIITDTAELATIVSERYDLQRRVALAERLYRIAMSDGTLSLHEERLMQRVGGLLGLTPADLAEARTRAVP